MDVVADEGGLLPSDASDIFEARLERDGAPARMSKASWADSREGPGTGGRGAEGGREGGGFGLVGVTGMWVGGAGKDWMRRGSRGRMGLREGDVAIILTSMKILCSKFRRSSRMLT